MAPEINPEAGAALRRLRIYWVVLGILFFLWLPIEDTQIQTVLLIAAAICTLFAARFVLLKPETRINARYLAVLGGLAGLCTAPAAVLLMVFKSGLHGHGQADFTPEQMGQVLQTAPFMASGGVLVGLGVHFWLASRRA